MSAGQLQDDTSKAQLLGTAQLLSTPRASRNRSASGSPPLLDHAIPALQRTVFCRRRCRTGRFPETAVRSAFRSLGRSIGASEPATVSLTRTCRRKTQEKFESMSTTQRRKSGAIDRSRREARQLVRTRGLPAERRPSWRQTLTGAAAGFLATAPMTAFMWAARQKLPWYERYSLPPRQLTTRPSNLDRNATIATAVSHFGLWRGDGWTLWADLVRTCETKCIYGPALWNGGVGR